MRAPLLKYTHVAPSLPSKIWNRGSIVCAGAASERRAANDVAATRRVMATSVSRGDVPDGNRTRGAVTRSLTSVNSASQLRARNSKREHVEVASSPIVSPKRELRADSSCALPSRALHQQEASLSLRTPRHLALCSRARRKPIFGFRVREVSVGYELCRWALQRDRGRKRK